MGAASTKKSKLNKSRFKKSKPWLVFAAVVFVVFLVEIYYFYGNPKQDEPALSPGVDYRYLILQSADIIVPRTKESTVLSGLKDLPQNLAPLINSRVTNIKLERVRFYDNKSGYRVTGTSDFKDLVSGLSGIKNEISNAGSWRLLGGSRNEGAVVLEYENQSWSVQILLVAANQKLSEQNFTLVAIKK